MTYTEAELKSKTVKDLKEIARELGAQAGGRKEELVAAIIAAQAAPEVDDLDDHALGEEPVDDLNEEPAADGDGATAAAEGKHASIVFALDTKEAAPKKANIVGVKTLSDAERAHLRAAKFGLAAKGGGVSKPAAGGGKAAAGGISAGGVGVGLEEEIKKLHRAQKFDKLSDADEKKLQGLQRKLDAQKQKQQLALDKVEMAEPDKMKQRQQRFGVVVKEHKDPKDPELMKKRAEKFGKVIAAAGTVDDAARKKARLERFAKEK